MPGVTDKWDNSRSRYSFGHNNEDDMPPHRRDEFKGRKHSSFSNGSSSDQQSDSNDDSPSFLIEHLATFTVSSSTGIHSPADGMRRLLQLEKQGGIWVQKMELRFDKKSVYITDLETGDLVEKFPRECFCDPTAFTSSDPKELYANIFVFVVNRQPNEKHSDNSEMHIFKCTDMSAQDIVDDVKMILNGKWHSGIRRDRHQIPPPPMDPAPEPPGGAQSRINVREQVSRFDAVAAATNSNHSAEAHSPRPQLIPPQHSGNHSEIRSEIRSNYIREGNEDSESNYSEKYERNIAVLNHCFDDIERFIARLHHAAAAYMELEKRKKSRKNKKKDIGDGMLSMRAKPPPEKEFIDTFQKFKLSFNLLAKLKSHIHDPNSPELVHFLFSPLTLIVDASRDANYGPNLPSKVVAPLLTRDTLDLFANCLTSKESELWHSLGDCWLIPREQWKGFVPSYRPVFMDGWSPDLSLLDEKERSEVASSNRNGIRDQEYHAGKEEADFYYGDRVERGSPGPLPPPPHHEAPRPTQAYENQQYESRHIMERQDDRKNAYREKIRTPPLDRNEYLSERDYRSRMDMEYRQGERIERNYPDPDYREYRHERDYRPEMERDYRGPVERDNRDRIEVRSDFSADSIERGGSPGPGPIPMESSVQFERQQKQWVDELRSRNCKIVQVKYPRTANNNKELTVVRGEFLEVLDDKRKWWKVRNCHAMIGHLPHTIVAELHGNEDDIFNNPLYSSRGGIPSREQYYGMNDSPRDRSDDSNFGSHPADSNHQGVVARSPVRASADWIRKERQGKKGAVNDEELSNLSLRIPTPPELPSGPDITKETVQLEQEPQCTDVTPIRIDNIPEPIRGRTSQEILNEELKLRMSGSPSSIGLVGPRNRGSQYYISVNSSPEEVKEWMISKDFSAGAIKAVSGVTGSQLFLFTKAHFEEMCGKDEGCRLESQVRIQKTTCGYNTIKKRGEELSTILARRKEEVEKESEDSSSTSSQNDRTEKDEHLIMQMRPTSNSSSLPRSRRS